MDNALIERSKTLPFLLHWFIWIRRYSDALAARGNCGYAYRAGSFFPRGAKEGQHHDDFPPFFNVMAPLGLPLICIEALFCYQTHPSCRVFIDTNGSQFPPP